MLKRVSNNRSSMEDRVKRMEEMADSPGTQGLRPLSPLAREKQAEILASELAEEREKLAMARKQQAEIKRIAQETVDALSKGLKDQRAKQQQVEEELKRTSQELMTARAELLQQKAGAAGVVRPVTELSHEDKAPCWVQCRSYLGKQRGLNLAGFVVSTGGDGCGSGAAAAQDGVRRRD